jgi:hypothetical protein
VAAEWQSSGSRFFQAVVTGVSFFATGMRLAIIFVFFAQHF